MSLPTFGQLLAEYMLRSGISDSELARNIGVRRQTIFRWKEGLVERPRSREDVLQCAKKLRLTNEERDRLLLAAGFAPEQLSPTILPPSTPDAALPPTETPSSHLAPLLEAEPVVDGLLDEDRQSAEDEETLATATRFVSAFDGRSAVDRLASADLGNDERLTPGSSPLTPLSKPADESGAVATETPSLLELPPKPSTSPVPLLFAGMQRWLLVGGALLLTFFAFWWVRTAPFVTPPTPTAPPPANVTLNPPPQTTPTSLPAEPKAIAGETLLLIAQFKDYLSEDTYNVAGRISEELTDQIKAVGLISTTVTTWSQEITTGMTARDLLMAANATIVIWGEYDSGRVRVNLEVRDAKLNQSQNFTLTSGDELRTMVNDTVPKTIRDTALFALGNLAVYQGEYEIDIARKLSELGNTQAAAALFQKALARGPTDPEIAAKLNFYLGYVTAKGESLNDYNRAIAYYSRAFTLNQQFDNALYNRGTIQIKRAQKAPANEAFILESLNSAVADLTAFIELRPNDPNGYFNRGVAYYERDTGDDIIAAITDFDQVIAMNDDNVLAYFHRGLAHIRAGQSEQWVDDFQQMLIFDPNDRDPITALCWGYVMAQQPAKALPYCDQAVQHDTTGFSHDSRGIAYAQLGRYPEAIADFRVYLDTLKAQDSMPFFQRNRGPDVELWITELEANHNPFDAALLERLRHRDHY